MADTNPQPPTNLPTGFGSTPSQQSGMPPTAYEPEDILAATDTTMPPAIEGPATPLQLPKPDIFKPIGREPLSAAVKPSEKAMSKEPIFKRGIKAVLLFVVGVVVVGAIGAGGWYGYQTFVVQTPAEQSATVNQQPQIPVVNEQEIVNEVVNEVDVAPPQPVDTDRDGLTDEEETLYGTNATQVDSDADGLTDRDEVKVFTTDPTNSDTDGDTYLDGMEVRGGYDPKGPGRLLEIEQL